MPTHLHRCIRLSSVAAGQFAFVLLGLAPQSLLQGAGPFLGRPPTVNGTNRRGAPGRRHIFRSDYGSRINTRYGAAGRSAGLLCRRGPH